MKTCYESGITEKFFSLMKFIAEMNGKARNDTGLHDQTNVEAIKIGAFLRGPVLTLSTLYPLIIIVIFLELYLTKYPCRS